MSGMGILRKGSPVLRVVGLLLLFAVFGLPLHSHALTEAPRITKECSCLHGTRTQTAPAQNTAPPAPLIEANFLEIVQPQIRTHFLITFLSIRAPPHF
jgi:hypothetical protein